MITFLLQTGYAALQAQAGTPSNKLQFTGFRIGDSFDGEIDVSRTTVYGNEELVRTASAMKYVPQHDDVITLQLEVPSTDPEIGIGNIILEVDNNPFCMMLCNHGLLKLSTIGSNAGIRYFFQLEIRVPDLVNRFDFDNISQNIADFYEVDDETDIAAIMPPLMGRDQGILQTHTKTGRLTPLLLINHEYWGCPLMYRIDDNNYFIIDGGESGDNYMYTPDV